MINKRCVSFCVLLCLCASLIATPIAFAQEYYSNDFENSDSLEGWGTKSGSIEITDEKSKLNTHSLKWSYNTGDELSLTGCDAFSSITGKHAGIRLWIYNTNSVDADITVKIGSSETIDATPKYQFSLHMNFTGWRCVWARVNQFAKTDSSASTPDTMKLVISEEMQSGTIYIDAFDVRSDVYYDSGADDVLRDMIIHSKGYQYAVYNNIPRETGLLECTDIQKAAFSAIEKKLDEFILPSDIDYDSLDADSPLKLRYDTALSFIETHKKSFTDYKIARNADGSTKGPCLINTRDDTVGGVKVSAFEKIWIALALDWKLNANEDSYENIMLLFDYFNEQGWAAGSSMGCMHFSELYTESYAYALYMMRDELKTEGKLEREMENLCWRSELGCIFSYDNPTLSEYIPISADKMRTTTLFQLIYILCMEDSPLKTEYMQKYVEYLEYMTAPGGGNGGGIKKDYTLWHHNAAYFLGYGADAITVLSQIKYLIDDTCFDVGETTEETLWKTLETFRQSADKYDVPLRVRGRFVSSENAVVTLLPAYAFFALCVNEAAKDAYADIFDMQHEAVKSYVKSLAPSIVWRKTLGEMKLISELQVEKEDNKEASENFIFPYGGFGVFRSGGITASVGGFSKYIWDYEASTTQNLYGRYMNYGSVMLSDERGFKANGYDFENGWDWSRFPGSTAKHLTNDELLYKSSARHYSDETFLGGVLGTEGGGLYAMKLHDTQFDNSFRANKSYFFFDNAIICLGSDIENADSGHNTETILFQNTAFDDAECSVTVNDEVLEGHYEQVYSGNMLKLTDINGNVYIVPDNQKTYVLKTVNTSNTNKGTASEGNMAVAYIDHGASPSGEGYEYVILPGRAAGNFERFTENLPYSVLVKNSDAHIVKSNVTGEVGYAIFGGDAAFEGGIVKGTDRACMIMEKLSGNSLVINFTDPDLRITEDGASSVTAQTKVEIFGKWQLKEPHSNITAQINGSNTVLTFTSDGGSQLDAILERSSEDDVVSVENVLFNVNGENVLLKELKKDALVYCSADFTIKTDSTVTGIFAIFDDEEKMVKATIIDLSGIGKKTFTTQEPILQVPADGSYTMRLFLWNNLEQLLPIRGMLTK